MSQAERLEIGMSMMLWLNHDGHARDLGYLELVDIRAEEDSLEALGDCVHELWPCASQTDWASHK